MQISAAEGIDGARDATASILAEMEDAKYKAASDFGAAAVPVVCGRGGWTNTERTATTPMLQPRGLPSTRTRAREGEPVPS